MSRTIPQIQAEMDAQQALQPDLTTLDSPSQSAIYTLWKYIMAYSIYVMENLWDIFKVELQTIADNAPVGTVQWVRKKVFDFQYSSTNPQIVQLVDFVPQYNPIDDTLKIITRCSVRTLPTKVVSVKVAKSEPPQALAPLELSSLTGYLDTIGFAGVQYNTISLAPDQLYLNADIFYDGQYSAIIEDNVIAAIENYLINLPFDGNVLVSEIENAIQAVAGVRDIVIRNMAMRADANPFSSTVYMVQNNTTMMRYLPTYAGYVIGETTPGNTFTDTLNFIIG